MLAGIPRVAKALLVLGVVTMAASFIPNHFLNFALLGDPLEVIATASLVIGACVVVRALSQSVLVTRFLITGSACLILARVLDMLEEFRVLTGVALVGREGLGHSLSVRVLETFGYVCVLLTMLAIVRELAQLKMAAESEHRRLKDLHEASLLPIGDGWLTEAENETPPHDELPPTGDLVPSAVGRRLGSWTITDARVAPARPKPPIQATGAVRAARERAACSPRRSRSRA